MLHESNPSRLFFNYPFHLKYIFHFSHRYLHDTCPLESLVPLIQSIISSWTVSTHSMFSHILGDNVSYSRSFLYLFPIELSSPSLFIPKSTPSFSNPASWLSPTFNTPHFSHLTTINLINNFPLDTSSPLFFHAKFKAFVKRQPNDIPTISNPVVGPLHSVPEPSYLSCSTIFDGWFGIPLNDANCFTHVRSPYPIEILRLYGLSCLIPLYSCTISALQIRTLVLHVLPLQIPHHIAQTFISDAVPPAIPPPTHFQCISNCFTLQPLPAQHNWEEAYQNNSEMKLFLDHLSINAPLDQSTIRTLPAACRTTIARNQIGLLSGRLVYYEHISFAHRHIHRIVVPLSLRPKFFLLMHVSLVAEHIGEYRTVYRIRIRFFWPRIS